MIVFEERLGELVELLPDLTDASGNTFDIRYNWGTIDVLNKFLLLKESQSKYPLIWLSTEQDDSHNLNEPFVKRTARIIIATRSDKQDEFNPFIYETDYKLILQPIADWLVQALQQSGASILNGNTFRSRRVPNFSINNNGNQVIDVWNAIVIDAEITFNNITNCLNTINFN